MLTRLLKAMRFAADLDRGDYFVALLTICVAAYLIVRGLSASGVLTPNSLQELMTRNIFASAALAIVCLPVFVGRLSHMGWPTIVAVLLFVPLVPQVLFIYHLTSDSVNASHQPATYLSAMNYSEMAVLAFALALLVWPGRNQVGDG